MLNSQQLKNTKQDLQEYVLENINSKKSILLKMQTTEISTFHFGNFRVSELNFINFSCDLAILIGEKQLWGRGLGAEAINAVMTYLNEHYSIKNFFSFINSQNIASIKIFKNNNFKESSVETNEYFNKSTKKQFGKIYFREIN